jgi:hypothetical protein
VSQIWPIWISAEFTLSAEQLHDALLSLFRIEQREVATHTAFAGADDRGSPIGDHHTDFDGEFVVVYIVGAHAHSHVVYTIRFAVLFCLYENEGEVVKKERYEEDIYLTKLYRIRLRYSSSTLQHCTWSMSDGKTRDNVCSAGLP